MRVLFWNTNKNQRINTVLRDIITENHVSVVVLAEYNDDINNLLDLLTENRIVMRQYVTIGCERITIIGSETNITSGRQTRYASFQINNNKDILCCVHLPSKLYSNEKGMREIAIETILTDIKSTEEEINTENIIIVGDLNMNPYENGCLGANKLHAIPIYNETLKKSRRIAGRDYKMYYNPMWNFFGDHSEPYGTYYYSGNDINNSFWHLYDQVIISPVLKNRFKDSSLKIITETNKLFLLDNKGYPNKEISDHLPIIFEIQEDLT